MRHPGSSTRRYAEYGHMPQSNSSGRGGTTISKGTPDVVIHNSDHGQENHERDMHFPAGVNNMRSPPAVDRTSSGSKLSNAANPNRADIPASRRKGSYDPVSLESELSPSVHLIVVFVILRRLLGEQLCCSMLTTLFQLSLIRRLPSERAHLVFCCYCCCGSVALPLLCTCLCPVLPSWSSSLLQAVSSM